MGVGDRTREEHLLFEKSQCLGLASEVEAECLECHRHPELQVFDFIDFPHAACPEQAVHAIAPGDQVTRGEGGSERGVTC
jgi:hypothetical protein